MFAGRYQEALNVFESVETEDIELSAWIYVKVRALLWVTSWTDLVEQKREPDRATALAGRLHDEPLTYDEREEIIEQILDADAISPLGWFNQGVDFDADDESHLAMHAYLVTAVTQEGDVEAWVNVAILAMNEEDQDLLATSVLTGSRLNSQTYLKEFSRQLKLQIPSAEDREELLSVIRALADPAPYDESIEELEGAEVSDHRNAGSD